jgi:uncharacterized protein with NRDE domain
MCTILALQGMHPEHPLIVLANRDEALDRASTAPQVLGDSPRAVGGVDLAAGGTWMGANDAGLFVGLTNQRTDRPPDAHLRSRGEVVRRALARRDPDGVEADLRALDADAYNPFNLMFGVPGDLRVAHVHAGQRAVEILRVDEPVVVLPNDRLHAVHVPKIARAESAGRTALARALREGDDDVLLTALADHRLPGAEDLGPEGPSPRIPLAIRQALQALCVHLPFYGTVSATALFWRRDGTVARFLHAPGPPCVTAFEDVTALLSPPPPSSET